MYSLEEHIFFVKSYYSTQKNLKEVICLYREQFNVPHHKWPSKSVIIRTVKKFKMTGSVHNVKAGKVGAKRTAQSKENIDQARKIMHATPQSLSVASTHWILMAQGD